MDSSENNNAKLLRTTNARRVRIFIASPGDVAVEREMARAVIDTLRNEFRYKDRVMFETVAWDQPGAAVAQEATLTPQAAIAKGLPQPAECDVVVVVFWSRMGTPLPAEYTKPDGSRYLSGTEWEFCNAVEAAKENGRPTVWVYRRTQVPNPAFDDPQYEEKKQQWNLVQEFFQLFSDETGAIRGGINSYEEPANFKTQLEDHLRGWLDRQLAAMDAELRSSLPPTQETIAWQGAPYPGLRAFVSDEAPIFFGRQRETKELLDMLAKTEGRFVAVVGASGSGKSSLVAAGLLPALKDNAIDGSCHWLPVRFKPADVGDNPFMALAVQLTPLVEKHSWRAGELAAQLFEMPSLFTERLIAQVREPHPDAGDLLLVIDQFEELFTRCDAKYLSPFVDLIALVVAAENVRIVVTMRVDYYRNCMDWPALTALLNKGAYSLSAPGAVALLDVIREPARVAGLSFEEGLADRMLQDIGDASGRLALMAFALEKLYEAGNADRCLTHEAYESFGGVSGAIAHKADEICNSLENQGVDVDTALHEVFRELTTIDPERNVATRKRAPLERFAGDALRLTNALIASRLLVSDQGMVEVAHEVLFDSWPRLKDWVVTVRDDLRLHDRVQFEARAWADGGHNPYYLWIHERLEPVYEMFEHLGLDRNQLEEPLKSFVRPEAERLLEELEKLDTSHYRRAYIGDRLNQIGDTRDGVGVNEQGVPQIKWISVPPGRVIFELAFDAPSLYQDVAAFYIAKYPVTYCQYRAFLEAEDGYRNSKWWKKLKQKETPGEQYRPMDNHPADCVSWYDAMAFCRWLSARLGYEVRLPTEYEWQQAAAHSNHVDLPWEWDIRLGNTSESHLMRTTAVGMYALRSTGRNLEGPMDMAGNVWEWCLNKYVNPDDTTIDGEETRGLRGGSWRYDRNGACARYRHDLSPYLRDPSIGFRLCCESPNT